MMLYSFEQIVRDAWDAYDDSRLIDSIEDISAKVSTNHVFRIRFSSGGQVIAKLSFFGSYDHFVEDHKIINTLSNNLPAPFENFLARSLVKKDRLYIYRHQHVEQDIWVIFYRPIQIKKKLPKRFEDTHIEKVAKQIAGFHNACFQVKATLPESSKSTRTDIQHLKKLIEDSSDPLGLKEYKNLIVNECNIFLDFYKRAVAQKLAIIPVFIDWNIGNFSVTKSLRFYSRWDYDWFRMSSRMLDFYFFSRVVSDVGDKTVFTYNANTLMEPRFLYFLKCYHEIAPLNAFEIELLPQAYRFFLLNYVIKYGNYFFNEHYAQKLQQETLTTHLPSINKVIKTDILKNHLGL